MALLCSLIVFAFCMAYLIQVAAGPFREHVEMESRMMLMGPAMVMMTSLFTTPANATGARMALFGVALTLLVAQSAFKGSR